jgi:hypothetical protein
LLFRNWFDFHTVIARIAKISSSSFDTARSAGQKGCVNKEHLWMDVKKKSRNRKVSTGKPVLTLLSVEPCE